MTERVEAAGAGTLEASSAVPSATPSAARARQGYFAITLLIAAIVAWGFWETYYSQLAARMDLPSIVHVHAAVFTVWIAMLVAQAAAVVAGRVRLHRRFGVAGMVYGALVFGVGLVVSIGAPALRVRDGQFPLDVGRTLLQPFV